jgi:hypothetical protein
MKSLSKKLMQYEKTELIAIIEHMLRQEPDVQWLLTTPLPTSSPQEIVLDPKLYRQQVQVAMATGNQLRKHKRHEVERRLLAIKAIADGFTKYQQYAAAFIIYDVLVAEVIAHYNDYPDEYIAFSVVLNGCIDGLDTCLAHKGHNQETRLRILQALFAIYRFYTDNGMDLDIDIASLLVENATTEERLIIMDWVRTALSAFKEAKWYTESNRLQYRILLASLTKEQKK